MEQGIKKFEDAKHNLQLAFDLIELQRESVIASDEKILRQKEWAKHILVTTDAFLKEHLERQQLRVTFYEQARDAVKASILASGRVWYANKPIEMQSIETRVRQKATNNLARLKELDNNIAILLKSFQKRDFLEARSYDLANFRNYLIVNALTRPLKRSLSNSSLLNPVDMEVAFQARVRFGR